MSHFSVKSFSMSIRKSFATPVHKTCVYNVLQCDDINSTV